MREYEWSGNKEAYLWLYGKEENKTKRQLDKLKIDISKKVLVLELRIITINNHKQDKTMRDRLMVGLRPLEATI